MPSSARIVNATNLTSGASLINNLSRDNLFQTRKIEKLKVQVCTEYGRRDIYLYDCGVETDYLHDRMLDRLVAYVLAEEREYLSYDVPVTLYDACKVTISQQIKESRLLPKFIKSRLIKSSRWPFNYKTRKQCYKTYAIYPELDINGIGSKSYVEVVRQL